MGVGCMFLLVPAHPVCPGQNPESHKMVVVVVLVVIIVARTVVSLHSG